MQGTYSVFITEKKKKNRTKNRIYRKLPLFSYCIMGNIGSLSSRVEAMKIGDDIYYDSNILLKKPVLSCRFDRPLLFAVGAQLLLILFLISTVKSPLHRSDKTSLPIVSDMKAPTVVKRKIATARPRSGIWSSSRLIYIWHGTWLVLWLPYQRKVQCVVFWM